MIAQKMPLRLHRSELAVPATSDHFFEKAAKSAADAVFLDLEDAVAPERKVAARKLAVQALNDIDWQAKTMSVRVNGLDSEWALKDIVEIADACPRLDMIVIPKTATASDVEFVDRILTGIEAPKRTGKSVGIEILIESALGLVNVDSIAAASPRLEAIIFGIGDYSIDMRTFDRVIGRGNPLYAMPVDASEHGRASHQNDQWHFALAKIANACRAFGKRPIDGPYTDISDAEGFLASAGRAAALGFEGKWAIHPSQIELANEAFTPSQEEVGWAQQILQAIQDSIAGGRAAFKVRGVLIDLAHEKLARNILSRAELVGSRTRTSSANDAA
jgi:malyl-CoA/(S)-citramalyl-CoA lyase